MKHNPFTRTGALRLNHPLFRGRTAELDRLEQACLAEPDFFLLVYGGRQNGKTTVLLRLEERLRARQGDGIYVYRGDFQRLPRAQSADVYRYLTASLASYLPDGTPAPSDPNSLEVTRFFDQRLADTRINRFVLLLDELGALPDETRQDLASLIRSLHTYQRHSEALTKLQIVLAGGIELYNLAVVEASALRNVCEVVHLQDLSEPDAVALIADGLELIGVERAKGTQLGTDVYTVVHGHPYFTQRLGELLAARHLAGVALDAALVEELAWGLLEHDDPLLEHLRRSIAELNLEEAAIRLLSAAQRTVRTDDAVTRLELLGLARRTGPQWSPRSPLLGLALAEWQSLPVPGGMKISVAAGAVQQAALERYLGELVLEKAATQAHSDRAASVAEQLRLQRRANALADEITRLEVLLAAAPIDQAPTIPQRPAQSVATSAPLPTPAGILIENPGLNSSESSPLAKPIIAHPSLVTRHSSLITPELVHIPGGPFLMGSSGMDVQADDDEKPQHRLFLADYWLGKTPITNAQFRPFVEGGGYTNRVYWTQTGWQWREEARITKPEYWDDVKWNGADYPVVGVSWFEAVAYCRWLSSQTGHPFRLPNEAEWEKAARGPDGLIWPWGDRWEAGRCNSKEAGIGKTTPVGQYPNGASPYGVLDLAGNVWEWCATQWRKDYPYQVEGEWGDAYLELDKTRVLRGGSWYNEQKLVRGACRHYISPRYRDYLALGLRVASHAPLPGSES